MHTHRAIIGWFTPHTHKAGAEPDQSSQGAESSILLSATAGEDSASQPPVCLPRSALAGSCAQPQSQELNPVLLAWPATPDAGCSPAVSPHYSEKVGLIHKV